MVLNSGYDSNGFAYRAQWPGITEATGASLPLPITKPVLILCYRGPDNQGLLVGSNGGSRANLAFWETNAVANALLRTGTPVEFGTLSTDYVGGVPRAKAETFRQVASFIFARLFDYEVRIGTPQPVAPRFGVPPTGELRS